MTLLMVAAIAVPLLACLPAARSGRGPLLLLPLAPVPALLLALGFNSGELALPGLLLGSTWVLDELRRTFLLLTAILWLVSGLYAVGYMRFRTRAFRLFWLLTLTGNLGLILAADIPAFYTFFALMTFAAYGLIVHSGTDEARRAGRIYLIMAVSGEVLLFAGFVLAAREAGTLMLTDVPTAVAGARWPAVLLTLGFGVKAGLPLLHFWLPLAHPVAPTPASAVLSGAMIKAGLLGWLLVLPLEYAAPSWAGAVIGLGAVGALGAGVIGICQHNPKTVLAYSSISQMGLMTLMLGTALAAPALAPALVPVVALYALHHGLAKGALFLAVGLHWPRERIARAALWVAVALPGLALAGLPWTSGAGAKRAAKKALADLPDETLVSAVPALMTAGAVATLLLVLRFLYCLARQREDGPNPLNVSVGWAAMVMTSLVLFWWLPWPAGLPEAEALFLMDFKGLWSLSAPLLAGIGLALAAIFTRIRAPGLPAGDGVVLLESVSRRLGHQGSRVVARVSRVRPPVLRRPWWHKAGPVSARIEFLLRRNGGLVFLALMVLLVVLAG